MKKLFAGLLSLALVLAVTSVVLLRNKIPYLIAIISRKFYPHQNPVTEKI